jgi:hypothetical protein
MRQNQAELRACFSRKDETAGIKLGFVTLSVLTPGGPHMQPRSVALTKPEVQGPTPIRRLSKV